MLTKADIFIIILTIIISVIMIFYFNLDLLRYDEKSLIIKVDGNLYKEIELLNDKNKREILIETEYGYNLLNIEEGKVKVLDASCPDKLDVRQGEISNVGDIIVCLPNRLTIEIKGNEKDKAIDKLSR